MAITVGARRPVVKATGPFQAWSWESSAFEAPPHGPGSASTWCWTSAAEDRGLEVDTVESDTWLAD